MFWATFPHKVSWISLFFLANTFYSCHSAPEKIERGLSHYLSVLKSIAFHQAYVFEITEWKRKRKENRKNGILRNQIVLPSSTFDLHSAHWSCDVRKEWTSCKWKVFEGIMEAPCVAKELPITLLIAQYIAFLMSVLTGIWELKTTHIHYMVRRGWGE